MPERHFVKYTFLKLDPQWRRLDSARRAADKREFIAACEDFATDHLLRAFSTVGTRGDVDLLRDVIKLFLEDCPPRVAAIKAAVDLRDGALLRDTAHALKGAAANLSASALVEAAQTLERLGAENRLEPAGAAWRVLATEATTLMDLFRQMDGVAHAH